MKIIHCCLANFYIDDFSYQENILPKFHKMQGHEVKILASTETYNAAVKLSYVKPSEYLSKDGIPIKRIPYIKWLPVMVQRKLRIYEGIKEYLKKEKPEIIFLHDCQFLSIKDFANYASNNKVTIYVDSHTDFINSANNWLSKNILHKIIYRVCAKKIDPFTSKFYGTLPARNLFLQEVYKISPSKIELLPFGVDDSLFSWDEIANIRASMRQNLNITKDDFVLICGGKIDRRKNIHVLLKVIRDITEHDKFKNIKLILFGKPDLEMMEEILELIKSKNVIYIDWIESRDIHRYMFSADLAIFPGTHSVLWEEAIGLGLPCIFKRWKGIEHVDLGGNCLFIGEGDYNSIFEALSILIEKKGFFQEMSVKAKRLGPPVFKYSEISKLSIAN